jgi:hypothetical protein
MNRGAYFTSVVGTLRGSRRDIEEAACAERWRQQVLAQGDPEDERNWDLSDDTWVRWENIETDEEFEERTRVLFACESARYGFRPPDAGRRRPHVLVRLGVHVDSGCWTAEYDVFTGSSIVSGFVVRDMDLTVVLDAVDAYFRQITGEIRDYLPRRQIERALPRRQASA